MVKRMKTIKIKFSTLMLSVLILMSCTKESITDNNTSNPYNFDVYLSNDDGLDTKESELPWLVFPTVQDYSDAVDFLIDQAKTENGLTMFEDSLGYKSTRSYYTEEERDSLNVIDDVLSTLLNPNGKIQISPYLIRIDMVQQMLHVQNLLDTSIHFDVSSDVDFIDFLNGDISMDDLIKQEPNTKSTKLDKYIISREFVFCGRTHVDVNIKASASNAGIFSSINSKISISQVFLGSNKPYLYISVMPGSYYIYKSSGTMISIPTVTKSGTSKSYTINSYQGTRRFNIHNYRYIVNFRYGDDVLNIEDYINVSLPIIFS